jgi:hypothetical protein
MIISLCCAQTNAFALRLHSPNDLTFPSGALYAELGRALKWVANDSVIVPSRKGRNGLTFESARRAMLRVDIDKKRGWRC